MISCGGCSHAMLCLICNQRHYFECPRCHMCIVRFYHSDGLHPLPHAGVGEGETEIRVDLSTYKRLKCRIGVAFSPTYMLERARSAMGDTWKTLCIHPKYNTTIYKELTNVMRRAVCHYCASDVVELMAEDAKHVVSGFVTPITHETAQVNYPGSQRYLKRYIYERMPPL